ncbi:MAG: restriction endonuclease subunit S [Candidatus Accumulibacter sp.]|uniref:Restriction endonuclease subunit S n=1 Tax=Candidatus Accumulibacter cognatus TaxID=2954383 RepID=A0A7D5NBJ2_9PROT|nr:restriction endonuclease subunit S [Accumulibacter sp.]MBN8518598.1 restriction endonuclease subunit S [Accumulibacter sp.]MBO3712888.1 restriction endonuclease subunit S [Accumulibacter sp.]QLH48929.1 MAG: restriction endonuclease subunit S [Candidatus Accumulibacter cognatus]
MRDATASWQKSPLGELADIAIGGTPSRDIENYWASDRIDGFPWVAISDLHGRIICETKEQITAAGVNNSNVKLVTAGTVLMSFKLSLGRVAFAGRDLFTNEAIAAFKSRGEVAEDFFFYVLPEAVRTSATDVAIKGATLNKESLKTLRISYPCKAVQERITAILSAIDTAIEKTEALIAKYQQIKAGLMHDLFTRGVLPNGQLRPPREQAPELYQETVIGWIPRDWQYELLDKLALRGSGHTPNKNFPEYWNGGVKWVSLADSHRLDQLYISDTELQISHKGIQNSSAVLYPAGIVVLSRDAGVGKSAITTEPMAVSQHFMCWKCDQKMDNHFLYYWLQFNKRTFENIAMGSTILTIGLGVGVV